MSGDARTGPSSANSAFGTPSAKVEGSDVGAKLFGRNFVFIAVASFPLIVGTIASPFLVRLMSQAEFGALATAITVVQVIAILAVLGLDQAVLIGHGRVGGLRAARGLIATGTVLAFAVAGVLAATAPIWAPFVGFGGRLPLAFGVAIWTAPAAAAYLALQSLLAQDRLGPFVLLTAITGVIGPAVAIVLLAVLGHGATTYVWVNVGAQVVAAVIGHAMVRPRLSGLRELAHTRIALRLGLPLTIGAISTFVLSSGDRLIVQAFDGVEAVARYQVAYVIGSAVILVLGFLQGAWVPRLASIHDDAQRLKTMLSARALLLRVTVPAVLGVVLVAPTALIVLTTPDYRPESLLPVVVVVVLAAFAVAGIVTSNAFLIGRGRGRAVMTASLLAAASNLVLNIAIVPAIGIVGAALATILAYAIQAIVLRRFIAVPGAALAGSVVHALPVLAASLAAIGTILLPWNDVTILVRFVLAVACLPWLALEVQRARKRMSAVEPLSGADTDIGACRETS